MRHLARLALPVLVLFLSATGIAATASAQPSDRFTMGNNVVVAAGEQVASVVTMGGNATIDGDVLGDVMTMGGNVLVTGHVSGDLVTLGGNATLADGATVDGEVATMGGSLHRSGTAHVGSVVDTSGYTDHPSTDLGSMTSTPLDDLAALIFSIVEGAVTFFLLFLLGLALSGGAPERFTALKVVIARDPVQVGLKGLGGVALAIVVGIVLAITIVGIPLTIALGLAVSLASYVGLAAVAAVIGLVLPIPSLKDRPVHQLAAGVGTLYVASLVPGAGGIALAIAAVLGLGALLRTRLSKDVPPRLETSSTYRDSAYPQAL